MPSRSAGGCDFASAADTTYPSSVLWTANALPSVLALTELPAELSDGNMVPQTFPLGGSVANDGNEHLVEINDQHFRVHFDGQVPKSLAVLLPFDRLFTVRVATAIRLWRGTTGRKPDADLGLLSQSRIDRLILALRAIDGRADNATYREVALVLFGATRVTEREWKTHDLRDKAIRLVRFGNEMTRSGYRRLLNYPSRVKS